MLCGWIKQIPVAYHEYSLHTTGICLLATSINTRYRISQCLLNSADLVGIRFISCSTNAIAIDVEPQTNSIDNKDYIECLKKHYIPEGVTDVCFSPHSPSPTGMMFKQISNEFKGNEYNHPVHPSIYGSN